jgi:hypothetical protein
MTKTTNIYEGKTGLGLTEKLSGVFNYSANTLKKMPKNMSKNMYSILEKKLSKVMGKAKNTLGDITRGMNNYVNDVSMGSKLAVKSAYESMVKKTLLYAMTGILSITPSFMSCSGSSSGGNPAPASLCDKDTKNEPLYLNETKNVLGSKGNFQITCGKGASDSSESNGNMSIQGQGSIEKMVEENPVTISGEFKINSIWHPNAAYPNEKDLVRVITADTSLVKELRGSICLPLLEDEDCQRYAGCLNGDFDFVDVERNETTITFARNYAPKCGGS